jgi:argininosuccinate lyase
VPRLPDPQDPLLRRLNASSGFEIRLWPQDVMASKVHARRLREAGVVDDGELAELERGLDAVAAELESGVFDVDEADEDIHITIERRLTELVGPVGGKLYTARSRNDQVATDLALYVRERCRRAVELIAALMKRLLDLAERHADWPMPGYTHLQRTQAVYLAHHLLAYFWMLERDALRFDFASRSTIAARLSDLTPEELRSHSELLDDSYYELLRERGWIESKVSAGGTASARVAEQLDAARAALAEIRAEARR